MTQVAMPDRVMEALRVFGPTGEPVALVDVARELVLTSEREKSCMRTAVRAMVAAGEIKRIKVGVIAMTGVKRNKSEIKEAMWTVIRMRKMVTLSDLMELAQASEGYAKEYLGMLQKNGVVERIKQPGKRVVFRLVADSGPGAPADDEKTERQRVFRQRQKEALGRIDAAGRLLIQATQELAKARLEVNDLDGGAE